MTLTAVQQAPSSEPMERVRTRLRVRLLGMGASNRFWGWAGPTIIALVGGFLRFWHLDRPEKLVFDETYYVKQAASYLQAGYEQAGDPALKEHDKLFASGTTDVFGNTPDFVVHPPVGKWMIAFGELLLGSDNQWGWRFSSALIGTLSLLMMGRIARRLFGSTLLGCTAALLLAVDGQHFVHSRTGLLDLFVMFWVLAGFGCLLIDRDRARARLADRVARGADVDGFGPGLGIRWWRMAAGICLGLAVGVKWSGLFFLAVFGLMTVFWDLAARRAVGGRRWWATGLFRDGGWAAVQMLPLALGAYLASWTGWFRSQNGYHRQWAAAHPSEHFGWVPDSLRSLWKYHQDMYGVNVGLSTPHPYQSSPWSWLVLGRPTAFEYEGVAHGQKGCTAADCSQAITAIGNPVIWWGGTIAIGVLLVRWALGRDWRAGAILSGLAAGYLPWFNYQDRTIYNFYAVAFVPWVVLALTYVLGMLLGPQRASPDRRLYGAVLAGTVVLLAVMAFAWFYPIYVYEVIPRTSWSDRMWLPSWI